VTGMVTVPPAALLAFGLLALAACAVVAVLAPPRGIEWLAFVLMVAWPAALTAWGAVLLRRSRHGPGVRRGGGSERGMPVS
jgi:hypothetical protein